MNDIEGQSKKFSNFFNLIGKVGELYLTRVLDAQKSFITKMDEAVPDNLKRNSNINGKTSGFDDQNPLAGVDIVRGRFLPALSTFLGNDSSARE